MSAVVSRWTPENIRRAQAILGEHLFLDEGIAAVSAALGFPVTRAALDCAFAREGLPTPHQCLRKRDRAIPPVDARDTIRMEVAPAFELPDDSGTTEKQPPHERFASLVDLVKKHAKRGGVSLEQLCDELEMSPRVARGYLNDAREVGITIDIAHEKLLFRAPEPSPSAPPMAITPSVIPGRDHRIAVVSDLHFGSLYCLREQFRDFVLRAHQDLGVKDFFCPGDVLEGYYRHAAFERSAESWEGQANEFLDWFPQLPDTRFFFIDGNHDFTWSDRTGVESGRNLVRLARERGRDNLVFMGSRGILSQYGDTRIELWHPKKGKAYAISYQLQNKIRDTAPARLPNILLCGHVHEYVKFRRSDVWAFYCGTFQHGDAPYGKSIGGDVAMGGLIIDWRVDPDGKVRFLGDSFFLAEHEAKIFDIAV